MYTLLYNKKYEYTVRERERERERPKKSMVKKNVHTFARKVILYI